MSASEPTPEEPDPATLDRVFAALADPVSRHIQVLVRAGLVTQERTGRISRCRLDAGPIYQAAVWVNRYSKYWQAQFDTLAAWLEEIDRRKTAAAPAAPRTRIKRPGRRA